MKFKVAVPRMFYWDWKSAFIAAYAGIRYQGGKCMDNDTGSCRYRGSEIVGEHLIERKCAIGWLIPDSHYHSSWEGVSAVERIKVLVPHLQKLDINFIAALQGAHDNWSSMTGMNELADKLGLTIPNSLRTDMLFYKSGDWA